LIDIESGRELWSTIFEGETVFGPKQMFIAKSPGWIPGAPTTKFIDGRTQQQIFAVKGVIVGFDPTGRMALVELRSDYHFDKQQLAPVKLRLIELSTIGSFTNEGRWPIIGGMCDDDTSKPFLTLSDRANRIWNANDWRRAARKSFEQGGVDLAALDRTAQLQFKWSQGLVQVIKWEKDPVQKGYNHEIVLKRGTLADIETVFPELVDQIQQGVDMTISEFASRGAHWLGTLANLDNFDKGPDSKRDIRWKIFHVDGARRQLFKTGTTQDREGSLPLSEYAEIGMFFLDKSPVVAVHEDACTLALISLLNGTILGRVRSALHNVVRVKQITHDTLVVYSKNVHQAIESVQIFDFPYLNEGPWFMFAGSEVMPTQHGTLAPKSDDALVPFEDWGALRLELTGDGATLIVQSDDDKALALSVPPWGDRLRNRLVKN
jgi:hypothetical protein